MQQPEKQGNAGGCYRNLISSDLFLLLKAAIGIESNLGTEFREELLEFVAQSTACILEVEAKVKHALLRVQSDAVAHILRAAEREQGKLKSHRQLIQDQLLLELNESVGKMYGYETLVRAARKCKVSFKKEVRKAVASIKEAALQFHRVSQISVKLQTQNRKVRRLAKSMTIIESGFVVTQSDFKIPDSVIKELYYADSERLYFLSYSPSEEDKLCSASLQPSLGNGMKIVTPVMTMYEKLLNLEICYLNNVGPVMLLLDVENWESKVAHLRVMDDSTSRFFDGTLEVSVPEAWSMQLVACLNGRLIVFSRSSATAMEVQISRSLQHSNTFRFSCIREQQLSSGAKAQALAYNAENDYALVTYENRGSIIKFTSNALYKSLVYINAKVLAGAVSKHLIFYLYLVSNDLQELRMFDVYGTELGRIECDLGSLVSPWFTCTTHGNRNNLLLCVPVGDEIWLLRRDNVKRTVGFVRLAPCGRETRRGTCELRLQTDAEQLTKSCLSVKFEYSQPFTIGVPVPVPVPGLRQQSANELLSFMFAQDDSAIYLNDYFNKAVRRYSKVFGNTLSEQPTEYQIEHRLDCTSYVTGMCILDDRTLVLVYSDGVLAHVDSTSMRQLHSLRFSKRGNSVCFTHAVTVFKLALAFYSDKLVLELKRAAESGSTWLVFKSHVLPVGWHVRYLHFDSQSRRHALTIVDEAQSKVRTFVLDEQFSQILCVAAQAQSKRIKRAFLCDELCFVESDEGFALYHVGRKAAYLGELELFTCCLLAVSVTRDSENQDTSVCTFMHYETSNLTRVMHFLGLHRTTYRLRTGTGQPLNRLERKNCPRVQTVRETLSSGGKVELDADRKRPLARSKEQCKVT